MNNGNRRPPFSVKRNHVIISALVLMIAVAGYLNYMDSTGDYESAFTLTGADEIMALIMDDTLGQEVAVVNTTLDYAGNLDFTHDPTIAFSVAEGDAGTAVFVNSASDSSFFIQAKLNREQARSS